MARAELPRRLRIATAAPDFETEVKARKTKDTDSYAGLEEFISAKVFSKALRRSGRDLSRERFMATLESMGKIDVGGFSVTYSPNDHAGGKFVH